MPLLFDGDEPRSNARKTLESVLGRPVRSGSKMQPIFDWTDNLIAYAVWIER